MDVEKSARKKVLLMEIIVEVAEDEDFTAVKNSLEIELEGVLSVLKEAGLDVKFGGVVELPEKYKSVEVDND